MTSAVLGVATFVLTYGVLSLVAAGCLRWAGERTGEPLPPATEGLLGLAFGPALPPLALYALFLLVPGQPVWIYVALILAGAAAAAAGARRQIATTCRSYVGLAHRAAAGLRVARPETLAAITLIAIVVGFILFQGVWFPILSHDGSIYEVLGNQLAASRSLHNYPMMTPDPATGFLLHLQHAPGLPLLYAWFSLLEGSETSIVNRTVSPVFAVYQLLALALLLRRRRLRHAATLGVLSVLAIPVFVSQAYDNSIDPPRMLYWMVAVTQAAALIRRPSVVRALVAGLAAGLMLFFHATGLLGSIVIVAILAVATAARLWPGSRAEAGGGRSEWRKLAGATLAVCVTLTAVGGPHYLRNLVRDGHLFGDAKSDRFIPNVVQASSPAAEPRSYFNLDVASFYRNWAMHRAVDRWQLFLKPHLFGAAGWLSALALLVWARSRRRLPEEVVYAAAILLFAAPVLYKYYVNRRYILTVLPLAGYFVGLLLARWYAAVERRGLARWVLGGAAAAGIGAAAMLASTQTTLGGRLTEPVSPLRFFLSSKATQYHRLYPGLSEAISVLNSRAGPNELVLTTNDAQFFRYAACRGLAIRNSGLAQPHVTLAMVRALFAERSFDYVLIDAVGTMLYPRAIELLEAVLATDPRYVLIQDGPTRLWERVAETPPEAGPRGISPPSGNLPSSSP